MAWLVLLGALLCLPRVGVGSLGAEGFVPSAPHNCPYKCVCAADLLSCTGLGLQEVPAALPAAATDLDLSHNALQRLRPGWLTPFARLRALHLGHNELDVLGRGVFTNASGLRLLDLSSNELRALGRHDLEGLGALERLLLFNNRLAHLDEHAFRGLGALSALYLGCNELSSFSFHHLHGLGATHLRTLDLSSNRLGRIPATALAALPAFLKNGLYLHNNPLPCDCRLYQLLRRWHQRGLSAVSDFTREYTCLAFKVPASRVRFFEHSRVFENCSATLAQGLERPEEQLHVQMGRSLRLRCNTSIPALRVAWVSPKQELLVAPGVPRRQHRCAGRWQLGHQQRAAMARGTLRVPGRRAPLAPQPDARVQRERALPAPRARGLQHRLHHPPGLRRGPGARAALSVRTALPWLPPLLPPHLPLLPPPVAPGTQPPPGPERAVLLGAQHHPARCAQPQGQCPQACGLSGAGQEGPQWACAAGRSRGLRSLQSHGPAAPGWL